MRRKRVIKQYGGSKVIALEPADLKDFNIKVGDEIIIDDIIKAQDIIDSPNYDLDGNEINSETAQEDISNILTKRRNDKDGLPL